MKAMLVILTVACTLLACGGEVQLRPELQAQLDDYENLIQTYQTKFDGVQSDPPAFKRVADDYSREIKAWMSQWETVAPNLSDEEGKAVKARIDSLNQRAVRMLQGA